MLHGGRVHFSNTLTEAIHFPAKAGPLASSPKPLLIQLTHNSDEVDTRFLRLERPLPVPRCLQVNLPVSGQHPLPAVPVAAVRPPLGMLVLQARVHLSVQCPLHQRLPQVSQQVAAVKTSRAHRIPRAAPRSLSLVVSFATSWPPLSNGSIYGGGLFDT